MKGTRLQRILACLAAGLVFSGTAGMGRRALAQTPAAPRPPAASSIPAALRYQRSVAIYNFKTAGESGPQRGEEIYYIKCWMCHNRYTIQAQTGAVPLKDLYKRPQLVSGQPVNDQTVAEKIRHGGPAMPAYRYSLSDADLADLLSYLRERCCFEADEPPRNPWYRY